MKTFITFTFLLSLTFLSSCGNPKIKQISPEIKMKILGRWLGGGYELFELDHHIYLSRINGGIIHLESCPCKNKNKLENEHIWAPE